MPTSLQEPTEATVALSDELVMTRFDRPIEEAVAYLRLALLNDPDVIEHLVALSYLRTSPVAGERAYWEAIDASPLRDSIFSAQELDHLARVIRDRLALGVWATSVPVNPNGRGYGRTRQRARSMSYDTIELAIADFITSRINPERESAHVACSNQATIRSYRRRLRELSTK
jgi:hypothetical protein